MPKSNELPGQPSIPPEVTMPTYYGSYSDEVINKTREAMRKYGFTTISGETLWGSDIAKVLQAATRAAADEVVDQQPRHT